MNLFDIAKLEEKLQILEKQTMEEKFWNDSKNSSKILTQIKNIKNKTVEYKKIKNEKNKNGEQNINNVSFI